MFRIGSFKTVLRFFGPAIVIMLDAAWGQAGRKLHTRDVTRLSQIQIADYLKRSDAIFVAVGAIEAQGYNPSDREYIAPLGSAAQMAEEADALYLPNLCYFYPGSTITSAATVYTSIPLGEAYLKAMAHSLLRQGFRTQIWVWHGHGPSPLYVEVYTGRDRSEIQGYAAWINGTMIPGILKTGLSGCSGEDTDS